jgi:hypothetical protein
MRREPPGDCHAKAENQIASRARLLIRAHFWRSGNTHAVGAAALPATPEGDGVKRSSLKLRTITNLGDVKASIKMTAYLADEMRSFGHSDLAKVYDLIARELFERCETEITANWVPAENRLH